MNGDEKSSKNIWAWIGKISIVLGAILLILQIVGYFKGPEYDISAEGDYSLFRIPLPLVPEYNYFRSMVNLDSLQPVFRSIKDKNEQLEAVEYLRSYLLPKYPFNVEDLIHFHSIFFFKVYNKGSKEVTGLNLELPFGGIYWINRGEQRQTPANFTNEISLGSLRPKNEISVIVWSYRDPKFDEEGNSRVTHTNGVCSINYSRRVRGLLAWNARNFNIPLIMVTLLLTLLVYGAFELGRHFGSIISERTTQTILEKLLEIKK
ncbi:MAG: hypothetical protein MUP17_06810 [candidate division Zixibacteria bacterium]|nr:hypothetical protein [candidate division Zixibacteria bacterium]